MLTFSRLTAGVAALLLGNALSACSQSSAGKLPAIPAVHGPLRVTVAYPADGASLTFGDSTFLFGTVGDGSASLVIANQPVAIAPNGAWLAWVALPRDSAIAITLSARRGRDSAQTVVHLRRADWVRQRGAWVDARSFSPAGAITLPPGEVLALHVRAAPNARVRLKLSTGERITFVADSLPLPVSEVINAFGHSELPTNRPIDGSWYSATLRVADFPRLPTGGLLDVISGHDSSRTSWPMNISAGPPHPVSVVLDDDVGRHGGADHVTVGRAFPTGTYAWFFPQGTRARADMQLNDLTRLRLGNDAVAWVPTSDVHPISGSDDERVAQMSSITITADSTITRVRIPLDRPVPSRVDESDGMLTITLFHAVADANWTRYPPAHGLLRTLTWRQESADRVAITVAFNDPVWGWRSRVDGTDLVFEFRSPPRVSSASPLRGRTIVIDAGHPPGGACGPTGLCEPEANLNVASMVRDQLVAGGATVVMTRTSAAALELWSRVAIADSVNADLLVSIHNNAYPDGLNPFTNNGTSTFFNHLQSLPLARAVQARLVASIGLRDLGIARGDLALARPTWYPAILTEGMFMMVPEQEAALRTAAGQHRYADAVVAGISDFLRAVADSQGHRPPNE